MSDIPMSSDDAYAVAPAKRKRDRKRKAGDIADGADAVADKPAEPTKAETAEATDAPALSADVKPVAARPAKAKKAVVVVDASTIDEAPAAAAAATAAPAPAAAPAADKPAAKRPKPSSAADAGAASKAASAGDEQVSDAALAAADAAQQRQQKALANQLQRQQRIERKAEKEGKDPAAALANANTTATTAPGNKFQKRGPKDGAAAVPQAVASEMEAMRAQIATLTSMLSAQALAAVKPNQRAPLAEAFIRERESPAKTICVRDVPFTQTRLDCGNWAIRQMMRSGHTTHKFTAPAETEVEMTTRLSLVGITQLRLLTNKQGGFKGMFFLTFAEPATAKAVIAHANKGRATYLTRLAAYEAEKALADAADAAAAEGKPAAAEGAETAAAAAAAAECADGAEAAAAAEDGAEKAAAGEPAAKRAAGPVAPPEHLKVLSGAERRAIRKAAEAKTNLWLAKKRALEEGLAWVICGPRHVNVGAMLTQAHGDSEAGRAQSKYKPPKLGDGKTKGGKEAGFALRQAEKEKKAAAKAAGKTSTPTTPSKTPNANNKQQQKGEKKDKKDKKKAEDGEGEGDVKENAQQENAAAVKTEVKAKVKAEGKTKVIKTEVIKTEVKAEPIAAVDE